MNEHDTETLIDMAVEADGSDPSPLLLAMLGLAQDLKRQRAREWAFRAFVIGTIAALTWFGIGTRNNTDDILRARAQSRTGLCVALDAMFAKHNHLVDNIIQERQRIIDETNAGTASEDRKAASNAFFQAQIESYRTDLLPIIDCTDPAQVNGIFTIPASPGG